MTWRWLRVRPGVLALSGTPYQVRHAPTDPHWDWHAFEHDKRLHGTKTLACAKRDCVIMAEELVEAGVIEDPRS